MNTKFSGPINLGNPTEHTILEIAKIIIQKINPKLEIQFQSLPKDDPTKRKPLIELAKEQINWKPLINLDNGLDKTIEYFKTINDQL